MASLKYIASQARSIHQHKNLAKYNLIVIIASCLDVCCVLALRNILYKFDNTQLDGLSQVSNISRPLKPDLWLTSCRAIVPNSVSTFPNFHVRTEICPVSKTLRLVSS